MFEESNDLIEFDENSKNSRLNSVSLDMLHNEEHCYAKEITLSNTEEYFVKPKKFQSEMQDITNENDPTSTFNKTSRMVPNILKNNSRLRKLSKSLDATNAEENVEIPLISNAISEQILCENILLKRKTKYRDISCKRKQKLSSMDTCHELSTFDICSFIDNKHEILGEHSFTSTEYKKKYSQRKRSKCYVKKCYRKRKTSLDINQLKENSLCPVSHEVSTDCTTEYNVFSPLQEIESESSQDFIDFSSNEIFNKFNYEFYNNNSNLDCFTWDTMDSDETRNSLSITYESEKEYDINGNEVDSDDIMKSWPLTDGKQNKRSTSSNTLYWDEEYCDEDTHINDNTGIKDRLLTETVDEDSEDDLNSYHFHTTESVEYLNNSTLNEYNDRNTCPPVIDTECLQCEDDINSPLMEFISYSNGKMIETEVFHETTSNQENNIFNDSSNETDFGGDFLMSENQEEDSYDTDTLQIPENNEHSTNKKEFQCCMCLLTFSNARTKAMHQADAHGGTYTILCESCGRLFNRKYHFNRHFTYCGSINTFKCHLCVKKYRHKSSLVYHLKVVHNIDYILNHLKKFTCNLCEKVYSRFGAFENHIKYHENASGKSDLR